VTGLTTALNAKAALTANQTFTGTQTLIPGSTIVPLIVQAHSSGTANILTVQSSTPTVLAGINNIGQVFTGSTAPLQNYPALVNAQMSVLSNSTTTPTMILRPAVSQTSATNIFEVQNSAGNGTYVNIKNNGLGQFQAGLQSYYSFSTTAGATTVIPNQVIGNGGGQTADLIRTDRSDGTVLGGINANGQIYSGLTTIKGSTVALTAATASSTTVAIYTYGGTTSLVTVGQLVTITNVTPSYFNSPAGGFAVTNVSGSSGAWTFTVAGSGFTASGTGTAFGTFQLPAQASITASSAGTIGLVVKGAANQTANLQEWQNSSGATKLSVVSDFASSASSTGYGAWLNIGNSSAPGSSPTAGGYLYSEAGALKWRGSSGTITTIAVA
jgi:hypothetical protein